MRKSRSFLGLVVLILSITLVSCSRNDDDSSDECNVSNPAEELSWLKEAIDEVRQDEYSYYVMATYKGKTVFYYVNCNPAVNYASIVQNCNGENLGSVNELSNELTDVTILWKHENSRCNFEE